MRIFALKGSDALGAAATAAIGVEPDPCEEREFEDGEHKARPLASVRGKDVYVIHSLDGAPGASANDKLCRLLFFLAACRENGARRVTAIAPYLAYSRKDRQTKARDPLTTRYVAQLFEAVGTDLFVTMDVHNLAAFQNAFRCRTVHLTAHPLFVAEIRRLAGDAPVTILSPDGGGMKRAQLLKEAYEGVSRDTAEFGLMEKRRSGGVVSGDLFAGEVSGRAVFVLDDMIATGGTMLRAAAACRQRGARSVHALATHGLFKPGSEGFLADPALDGTVVTDSVGAAARAAHGPGGGRLAILGIGALIGETIRRLHEGLAVSDLEGLR